ncbi:hypothetical protein WMY93_004325 [Mugilogobius chulae]|uniref:Uncharacterized protein n=1 Tax=Mugilogobius chulae TaxID=88201 RepID=A0AAW0PNR1_9GOBI
MARLPHSLLLSCDKTTNNDCSKNKEPTSCRSLWFLQPELCLDEVCNWPLNPAPLPLFPTLGPGSGPGAPGPDLRSGHLVRALDRALVRLQTVYVSHAAAPPDCSSFACPAPVTPVAFFLRDDANSHLLLFTPPFTSFSPKPSFLFHLPFLFSFSYSPNTFLLSSSSYLPSFLPSSHVLTSSPLLLILFPLLFLLTSFPPLFSSSPLPPLLASSLPPTKDGIALEIQPLKSDEAGETGETGEAEEKEEKEEVKPVKKVNVTKKRSLCFRETHQTRRADRESR